MNLKPRCSRCHLARGTLLVPMAMWPFLPRPIFFMTSKPTPAKLEELPSFTGQPISAAIFLVTFMDSSAFSVLMPT